MSRVKKSLKNSKAGLLLYAFQLLVTFFSRKYFIDYLGSELLGLNTIAVSLLNFLNLAELGVGAAISYSLYKPLLANNRRQINDIISVQAYLYKNIGLIILGASLIVSFFFPYFFGKANLPLWYAYITFFVLLFSNLLGYFFNYKQIIFDADQKLYKANYILQGGRLIKSIFQIFGLIVLPNPYIAWLTLEVIFAILSSIVLQTAIRKDYPWLNANAALGRKIKKEYPDIITKTKQIFFHKIGGIALSQTTPLLVYAYVSLVMVTKYGNYMLIVAGVTTLIVNMFNGMNASIGNLIAEDNPKQTSSVFWELFSFRFWFVSVLCAGLLFLSNTFVSLWLGSNYVLDNLALFLIVATAFIQMTRGVVESYLAACGLFKDIWAPLAETAINIGLSILLGYYYGLHGILCGVLLSLLLLICLWKPIFLFHEKMKESVASYFLNYAKYGIIVLICMFTTYCIKQYFEIKPCINNFWELGIYGVKIIGIYASLSFALFYGTSLALRDFSKRIYRIVLKRTPM